MSLKPDGLDYVQAIESTMVGVYIVFSPIDVQRRQSQDHGVQESLFPWKEIEDKKNDYVEIKESKLGPSSSIRFGFNNKSANHHIMEKLFQKENLFKSLERA